MLHKAQDLMEYAVHANDGAIGQVSDLFIDSKDWRTRYLVITTNNSMEERKLMVSMEWVERMDVDAQTFHLSASRHEIQTGIHQSEDAILAEHEQADGESQSGLDEALRETFPASDPSATY